jgi:hypothetical protein
MARMTDDEIERLANRLAMLVSDDGESDNAGRAVGALARRLGLTGGQLKAIFMAGAESAGGHSAQIAEQARHIKELEADLDILHENLRRAEAAARVALRERDAARLESDQLQDALDARRNAGLARVALAVVVVVVLAGAGWVSFYGPKWQFFANETKVAGSPDYTSAVVRDVPIVMHRDPDKTSPVVATVPSGAHLVVHRVFWHNLMQWVEVQSGGNVGYVVSTDLELS